MAQSKHRGRPLTYQLADRQHLADLIRRHGARGARERAPQPICVGTLLKIAGEFGIQLSKGRRPRKAA